MTLQAQNCLITWLWQTCTSYLPTWIFAIQIRVKMEVHAPRAVRDMYVSVPGHTKEWLARIVTVYGLAGQVGEAVLELAAVEPNLDLGPVQEKPEPGVTVPEVHHLVQAVTHTHVQFTVTGVPGQIGEFVQRLAEQEVRHDQETVTTRHRYTAVDSVLVPVRTQQTATLTIVPLTVNGEAGQHGDHVQKHAQAVPRTESVHVTIQRHNTAEVTVQVHHHRLPVVTLIIVQLMVNGQYGQVGLPVH